MMQQPVRHIVSKAIQATAVKDPDKIYGKPKDVLADENLKPSHKRRILESWALDMEGLMRAEEENMTKLKPEYSAHERLGDIQACLRELEGRDD